MPLISSHPQKDTIVKCLRESLAILKRQLEMRTRHAPEGEWVLRTHPSLYITKLGDNWQTRNISLAQHFKTEAAALKIQQHVLPVFHGATLVTVADAFRQEIDVVEKLIDQAQGEDASDPAVPA